MHGAPTLAEICKILLERTLLACDSSAVNQTAAFNQTLAAMKNTKTRLPSIASVRRALVQEWRYLRNNFSRAELADECSDAFSGTDVRVQVWAAGS